MRAQIWFGLLLIAAVVAIMPGAHAASTCAISATVCKGQSYVDTSTGGVAGAVRCFFLDTDATLGNHVCSNTQDRTTWEMNQGACVTLNYFDVTSGAVTPAVPNKVTLQVRSDNSATAVITFLNAGTEPANGATFQFCATSTGASGGAARSGTYRIYLNPVKDNGAGGVGNYNVDSDGTATVGAIVQFAKGALRGNMLVSALTASAPPSGTEFAYGPAGDESVTYTATRGQNNDGTGATHTISFDSRHASGGSIVETTTTTESATAATDTATSVIDQTYDSASTTYDLEFNIVSNAALTGLPWTTFPASGHGTGITQITTTKVRHTAQFTADPRIVLDKFGTNTFATADNNADVHLTTIGGASTTLFNKGETVAYSTFLFNARDQKLSRAMTFSRIDTVPTTCASAGSITPTSNKYTVTITLSTGSTCLAAHDTTGSSRRIVVTNTDETQTSANAFFVSSYLYTDAHTEKASALVKDNWPTQNSAEDGSYIIGSDVTNLWCHIEGVRLDGTHIDTPANAVTLQITETDDTTVLGTKTTDTDTLGWTTPDSQRLSVGPNAPSRIVHAHCDATFNGNTATDSQSISWISAYTADKACLVLITPPPSPGQTSRIWIQNSKMQAGVVPDQPPMVIVSTITSATWTNADHLSAATLNSVDNTATVNGALYYRDWTPATAQDDNILAVCYIEGATLQQSQAVSVLAGLNNATLTGTTTFNGNVVLNGDVTGGDMNIALTDLPILIQLGLVLILTIWAEKSKNPILYLIAVLSLAITIGTLWSGLVGYRTSLVVVLAFLAFRLYLTAKEVQALEN